MSSRFEKYSLPCPCGRSSDAYAVDHDGDGFCFSCDKYFNNSGKEKYNNMVGKEEYRSFSHRGISEKTFDFFGIVTKFIDDVPVETGFPHVNGMIKIRRMGEVPKKDRFYINNSSPIPGCFGIELFDPGSKDSITISEGLYDYPSVYEMCSGQTASVAVQSSSTAKRDCTYNYDIINSYKKIILCFDNDEQGKKAEREVASLFDFNKVYRVRLSKHKDPNEYKENKKDFEFYAAWKSASKFSPEHIISSFMDVRNALETHKEDVIGNYPFTDLENKLYGLHKGEVIVVKAPEGVGKTEFFRALEYYNLKNTKNRIGILHMEEDNATTIKGIATYELRTPCALPDSGVSNELVMETYKSVVNQDESRIFIHSSFDVTDEDEIVDNIRFLVAAAGCSIVFLDHITWLATGTDDEDERKKLDRISQRLKLLAMELEFCLVMISHVNDAGQTRGSRNISKVANTVISLSRDVSAGDNITNFVIDKARLTGRTGPAGFAVFNTETYTMDNPETGIPERSN